MAVINDTDIPRLREERETLARLAGFFAAGDSVERLPSGAFKVDPDTFMGVIPGAAKRISPYRNGTALFQKEWVGKEWVCDWFGMEEGEEK